MPSLNDTSSPPRFRHRARAWIAALNARLGQYLEHSYPATATSALVTLLAVLLGFVIGTTWSIRDSERRELLRQLEVLIPWQVEVAFLSSTIEDMGRRPPDPCRISFKTPFWDNMVRSGYTLRLKGDLYQKAIDAYNDLALAPENSAGIKTTRRCQTFLVDLAAKLEPLKKTMDSYIVALKTEEQDLAVQLMPQGLLFYTLRVLAVSAAFLLVPVALYWIGVLTARLMR